MTGKQLYVIGDISSQSLRSPAARSAVGRLEDGGLHGRRLRPSFETHRLRDAPLDEVREDADMIRTSKSLD